MSLRGSSHRCRRGRARKVPGSASRSPLARWLSGPGTWPGLIAPGNGRRRPGSRRLRWSPRTSPSTGSAARPGAEQGNHGLVAEVEGEHFRVFSELDYAPLVERSGIPAMVTLTYPADWLAGRPGRQGGQGALQGVPQAVGTDLGLTSCWPCGSSNSRPGALRICICSRWCRTAGPRRASTSASGCLRRGPPWSLHPDPAEYRKHQLAGTGVDYAAGLRSSDPRRIAVYFSKHASFSAKEYQNVVPGRMAGAG